MPFIELFYDRVDEEGNVEYGCTDSNLSEKVPLDISKQERCPIDNIVELNPEEDWLERSPVDLAVSFLRDHGLTEPSRYPDWHPGTWYRSADPEREDGTETLYSAHLHGFSYEEEREIYEKLKKHWGR